MVDLVKIRKKAREDKESGREPAGEMAPESREESRDEEAAVTTPGGRSAKRTPASGSGKSAKESKKRKSGGQNVSDSRVTEPAAPAEESSPAASPPQKKSAPDESSASAAIEVTPEAATAEVAESGESRLSRFKRTAGVIEEGSDREESDEQEASNEDLLEVITFNLAGEHYAMDVDHLVEIIVPRASTRVPNASDEVIGIISLRGSIVTLLDLRKILKHPGRGEETEDTRIVVVQHENERIGLIVDKVLRVVKVERSSIEPQPVVSAAENDDVVRGVFVSGETITIYLDLQRIAGYQGVS